MTQQLKGYLPLFATNILMNYVEEDTDDLKEHCIKSPDQLTRSHKQNKTEEEKALAMEDNFRILEEYPRISDILLNKFKIAAKEMLGIPKTEFINIKIDAVLVICLGFPALNINKIGLKNIPPPIPTKPDMKPIIEPIKIDKIFGIFLIII